MASRRSKLRGLRISSPDDLAESLHNAAGAKLSKVRHFGKTRVLIELDWQGQRQAFLADVVEVWNGEVPDAPEGGLRVVMGNGSFDPEGAMFVQDGRLVPLYRDPDWLQDQVTRLLTWKAVAAEYGFCEQQVIKWARRLGVLSPSRKGMKPLARREAERLLREGLTDSVALANATGVSRGTAWKWKKEFERHGSLLG